MNSKLQEVLWGAAAAVVSALLAFASSHLVDLSTTSYAVLIPMLTVALDGARHYVQASLVPVADPAPSPAAPSVQQNSVGPMS